MNKSHVMRALTWNIMVDDNSPDRYIQIAQMLCSSDVSIVCLQEVTVIGWYYMGSILEQGGWHALYGSPLMANSSKRCYGEMILYRSDVHITNRGYFLLPSSREGRSVQWCEVCYEGRKLVISTGHLESGVCNALSRRVQWSCIMREFKNMSNVYWVGDCNMTCDEEGPSEGALYSYGDTYFAIRSEEHSSSSSLPYDRVWTNSGTKPELCSRYGMSLSDHDGLILIL